MIQINPRSVFAILIGMGVVYTAIWSWVMLGSGKAAGEKTAGAGIGRLRMRLMYLLIAAAAIVFVSTQMLLPYQPVRELTVGAPQVVVTVNASQYQFALSNSTLPANVPIEFAVTSFDVNHGFGVFSPDGVLIGQTQAMPGYTNRLILTFTQKGEYRLHCLEYCGTDHWAMEGIINVV